MEQLLTEPLGIKETYCSTATPLFVASRIASPEIVKRVFVFISIQMALRSEFSQERPGNSPTFTLFILNCTSPNVMTPDESEMN